MPLAVLLINAIIKVDPIITGISIWFKAKIISLPKPFHPKIYSTKIDPAKSAANHPERTVITGFKEFFKQWL